LQKVDCEGVQDIKHNEQNGRIHLKQKQPKTYCQMSILWRFWNK